MAFSRKTSVAAESRPKYALRVNTYDRASSVLIALLIMIGATVAGLVIVFFSRTMVNVQTAIPVTAVSASGQSASGLADDQSPGIENAPEELEPQLQDTLNLMAGLVAAQASLYDSDSLDNTAGPSKGEGLGDARGIGDGTGQGPPEPQREIRFEPETLAEYAQWFDQSGFELGVLGNDNQVYYASNLSNSQPKVRVGPPDQETRLYFNSTGGPLQPLDRQLAAKAGILGQGSIVLQFSSAETAGLLLGLEQQAAGDRPTSQISRTVFRVKRSGAKFTFVVEDQQYRF